MLLRVGDKAPDFELPASQGHTIRLSREFAGKPVVLFFYPRDFTAVCTAEACGFRDIYKDIQDAGVAVIGISRDRPGTHESFRLRYGLPYELLSDRNRRVHKLFGAVYPILRLPRRATFLLDKDHKVVMAVNDLLSASKHINAIKQSI